MSSRTSRWLLNPISSAGVLIAAVALIVFIVLYLFQAIGTIQSPYLGIILFMVTPAFLIFGLLLIPLGAYLTVRRQRKYGELGAAYPIIDLNDPRHRKYLGYSFVGVVLFLLLSAVGSYETYHYTDSVEFCGKLCHEIMKPEYTLYLQSPHARVRCVDCHVGAGANWYVKSKLSGAYQVYATIAKVYPKPIPTPIENLRPAQETCEQCHWPQHFFGSQQKLIHHFLPDEQNTEWQINMLIKTGGGSPHTSLTSGIHWHMNIANKVEYLATDKKRQEISWVRFTNKETGQSHVYVDQNNPVTPETADTLEVRTMDCMDCHNRPTHIYRSPSKVVNLAMATGQLDRTLPYLKRVATEALGVEYSSTPAALDSIALQVKQFYAEQYPELSKSRQADIDTTVARLQRLFTLNFFPEMRARWDKYPDNVGHLVYKGCFRCHDGNHVDEQGNKIRNDCTACHTILAQGPADNLETATSLEGLTFRHPEDIGGAWKDMLCSDCHTGLLP